MKKIEKERNRLAKQGEIKGVGWDEKNKHFIYFSSVEITEVGEKNYAFK